MKIYCHRLKDYNDREWALSILPELVLAKVDTNGYEYWYNVHIGLLLWTFTISFYKEINAV